MTEKRSKLAELLDDAELWRRILERLRSNERWKTSQLFQELVIDRLPKPAPITAGELAENLRHQLAGVANGQDISSDDWQKVFFGFLNTSLESEPHDCSAWFNGGELDLGTWLTNDGDDLSKIVECDFLWESDYFFISARAIPQGGDSLDAFKLIGTLGYCCSDTAREAAEQWMRKFVASIAKTVACCTIRLERPKTAWEVIAEDENVSEYGIPPTSNPLGGPFSTPFIFLFDEHAKGNLVFCESLNALAQVHLDEVDPFTRRLGNAVYMLSQADKTESPAVALVLSFTAIEAIICKKPRDGDDWGIDKQIKRLVPALLMPSPRGRGTRGNVLYDLYYTRSSTIHEANLDTNPLELHDVRQIAAGVLRAAIEWQTARIANVELSTWDYFYQELYRAATDQLPMRDVSDLTELLPGERRRRQYRQSERFSLD